jgi:hypothetical protein
VTTRLAADRAAAAKSVQRAQEAFLLFRPGAQHEVAHAAAADVVAGHERRADEISLRLLRHAKLRHHRPRTGEIRRQYVI